ncbi:hypothetical protein [Streptomyces sp. NPDC047315]|uniref:hypothetical protein n=1 Tax=Streptomyces sp. NPDC047315 TaxID=3155142 RepID=UPI0033C59EFF
MGTHTGQPAPTEPVAEADWEQDQVYIRLQQQAAEDLVLAAGFPLHPGPVPNTTVKVRTRVLCPACGQGRVSRDWRLHRNSLTAGSGCERQHVFVVPVPALIRAGYER